MRTKIASFLLSLIIILTLCGCSKDLKTGFGEFSDRIYKDFNISIDENSITLEKNDGKNQIYCLADGYFLVFYLGSGDNICGIAAMLPKDKETKLADFLDVFTKCVATYTLQDTADVKSLFADTGFTADKIKFTDGTNLYTVGKYKYSFVTNENCVTLFCERN